MATISIQFENKHPVHIECPEPDAQNILEYIILGYKKQEHNKQTTNRPELPSMELLFNHLKTQKNYEHIIVEVAETFCPEIKQGHPERTHVLMNISEKLLRLRTKISKNNPGKWVSNDLTINNRRCKKFTFKTTK